MTVAWSETALEDRAALLHDALDRALAAPDPQIYAAARAQDAAIEAAGNALDGAATYQQGPLPDSHVFTLRGGRLVILYRREDDQVTVERVKQTRTAWLDETE